MIKLKIGLLPLYIKLYDDFSAESRPKIDAFYEEIACDFEKRGIEVIKVPICRLKSEFKDAVKKFETEDADAIVTLHLAYSPSLKSSETLMKTKLPIIVLDTTPSYDYDPHTSPDELMYNHGIHGVQDMCNLLRRNGKMYEIFAGHHKNSDVMERAINAVKGAKLAKIMRNLRVGIIGEPFKGMGDFQLPDGKLSKLLGFKVIHYDMDYVYPVSAEDIEAEYKYDSEKYDLKDVNKDEYSIKIPVNINVRKWIEIERLNAFTMNFLSTDRDNAFPYMPFCAASSAMRDGIGYAGEGDVMTAALVGTFLSEYEDTSFTEMFCPDWKGNTIFLSHMGEQNLKCIDAKARMTVSNFKYTSAGDPLKLIGTFKAGKSIFVCISPQPDDRFAIIASEGEMLQAPDDNLHIDAVNGWFKPNLPIADFLEQYSRIGGIHHAALIYGGNINVLKEFAAYSGFDFYTI